MPLLKGLHYESINLNLIIFNHYVRHQNSISTYEKLNSYPKTKVITVTPAFQQSQQIIFAQRNMHNGLVNCHILGR